MMHIEEKIYYKVENCYKGFKNRQMGSISEENEKQYFIDMTNAMVKILKAEVNIRLQEEKHHPKGVDYKKNEQKRKI